MKNSINISLLRVHVGEPKKKTSILVEFYIYCSWHNNMQASDIGELLQKSYSY